MFENYIYSFLWWILYNIVFGNIKFKLATLFLSVLPTNLTSFIAPSVLDNKLRLGSFTQQLSHAE